MLHRHLNHQNLTPAAIDDIIARGERADWEALRLAVVRDPVLQGVIRRVCEPNVKDPYQQRYHFWNRYVESRRTA